MAPSDWQSARTLADLGQLTARWLETDLADVPGYSGPPAAETLTLVPVLAQLNRAGYLTNSSQPGEAGLGYDGERYEQRAAVEGFAGAKLTHTLTDAARDAGLTVIAYDPAGLPRWRNRYRHCMPVTQAGGHAFTRFGAHLSRRFLRDGWVGYGDCHPAAVEAVCAAWQVTVIDPVWGRPNLLWDVLSDAVTGGGRV